MTPPKPSSRKFSVKLKVPGLFFFVSLLALLFFYLINIYFQIKKIEIKSPKKDLVGINEIRQKNLLFINKEEIENGLIEKNPSVVKVDVDKKYPGTLILAISFEAPLADLSVGGGYFSLSLKGKILAKSKSENKNTPTINYYQKLAFASFSPGDFISFKDIKDSLFFIDFLNGLDYKVDQVDIGGDDMIVCNLQDKKIIFSSIKEKDLQSYQLEQIIRQFKIEGRQFREIDLRYDKPVIRF